MGNSPAEPLARSVEAMLVAIYGLGDREVDLEAINGPPGALIIRATAFMIADAATSVEDGKQREFAESVINEALSIHESRRGMGLDVPTRILNDLTLRLRVAVDALVGVQPYA